MTKFHKGDRVRIVSNNTNFHYFPVGAVGTVISERTTGNIRVNGDGPVISTRGAVHPDGMDQTVPPEDLALVEPPVRPMVDFSGSSRATARDYAAALVSSANKPESNHILRRIVASDAVDAYALNAVLPDIFSGCATRGGQSLKRREHTKMARHLAHITQAVLESHADNLPTYEPGDRSRAVEEAKKALSEAQVEIDALLIDREEAIGHLTDERHEVQSLQAKLSEAQREVATLRQVAQYTAKQFLTTSQRAHVAGYSTGLRNPL